MEILKNQEVNGEEVKETVENNAQETQEKEEEVVRELTPEEIAKAEFDAKVAEIVKPGKKGVTNFQMIPAMKANLGKGEEDNLRMLFKAYPEVFKSSAKYLPNDGKLAAEKIIQEVEASFVVPGLNETNRAKLTGTAQPKEEEKETAPQNVVEIKPEGTEEHKEAI